MANRPIILIVDNRPSVRLYLRAMLKSVGNDLKVVEVARLSQAREVARQLSVKTVVIGLEKYDPGRKVAFLQHISINSPNTTAVLIYDSEHAVRTARGARILDTWPKSPYFSTPLHTSTCRAVLTRALNSPDCVRKIGESG